MQQSKPLGFCVQFHCDERANNCDSNKVVIPKGIIPSLALPNPLEETDSPELVIQRPALMFTTCKEPMTSISERCENHYLRSINWEDTLLISAHKVDGQWLAYRCVCNPPIDLMKTIFLTSKQLRKRAN